MSRFKGKVAIVTGSASGIGRATAQLLAEQGAKVVISDISDADGEALANTLGSQHDVTYQHCDVGDPNEVSALVDRAIDVYGRLDVLCNNAGVVSIGQETIDFSVEDWERVIATNLNSVFFAAKAAIPKMKEIGGGAIVNTGSTSGLFADAGGNAYNATKAAVINFTRTLAIDHGKDGIRANAVCPGPTLTPMTEEVLSTDEMKKIWFPLLPLRRYGTAQDMANAIAFLASDEASFITGHALVVDGGITCQTGHPNLMNFTEGLES